MPVKTLTSFLDDNADFERLVQPTVANFSLD